MATPTPKEVRKHYLRLRYHWFRLQRALTVAHNADVIRYPPGEYAERSPCATHSATADRIDAVCKDALAEAMKTEIMTELKRKERKGGRYIY